MAKYTPGPMIGEASGRLGNIVFTHGQYGPVIRNRTIPVNKKTAAQVAIRNILSATSRLWGGLTAAERLQWNTYAHDNPVKDALGRNTVLAAAVCFIGINSRMVQMGETPLDNPPTGNPPDPLTTATATFDIGAGTTTLAFAPSPLGANYRLAMRAAVLDSAGRSYVRNLMKLCDITDANTATPYDWLAAVEERFGTLIVGQNVTLSFEVWDDSTGLISAPVQRQGVIVSTV